MQGRFKFVIAADKACGTASGQIVLFENGLIQAKQFLDTAGLTGIVLTKLDGTAKGGIVFAIAQELKLPVKYVGVGEKVDDLIPFDGKNFVEALFK